eukprot:2713727-Rhodomonas_salina.1
MGGQLALVQGRAVVVVAVDRWVDGWCRAGPSSSSRSTDGKAVGAGPGRHRSCGRQMGRQLVWGLAVVVVAVDRWVDGSQGPQN